MKKKLNIVFLLLCFLCLLFQIKTKDLFLHTIQYKLNAQKVLSMATVNLNNIQLPVFIMLKPQLQINHNNNEKVTPFIRQQDIIKQKAQQKQQRKIQAKQNFHKKLDIPIKILIHNQDTIEQQCIFDEPWDLCIVSNPTKKKSLDFSIHCLIPQNSQNIKSSNCFGKATLRQADLTRVELSQNNFQQKIKYQSGLFSLPQTDKHSVMLISCQDNDLSQFSESLKIFSNVRYHRYEQDNSQQIKQFVGFDRSSFDNKPLTNQANNQKISVNNKIGSSFDGQDLTDQENKKLISSKDVNFVYLDVKQQMVRKCLQFEFYGTNKIINERKVFDFLNLTDTDYKNIYSLQKRQTSKQRGEDYKKKVEQKLSSLSQSLFKYNMQITLDIFKPLHILQNEAYDIRIKLIDSDKQSTIISYIFPFAINSQSALHSTNLYSRSNHYHFTYIVGHQIIKQFKGLQIEVDFDARQFQSLKNTYHNDFFFITLNVEDSQNIIVQKLMPSYISLKKDQHLTFLIQQPYQVDQIKTQNNDKSTDLVEVLPSSNHLQIKLSQHTVDHQHINQCHFSKGCKFELDALNDCFQCKINYKKSFLKNDNDMLMFEIKSPIFEGKIDLDETQYFYKQLNPLQVIQFVIKTANIIVYTLENNEDLLRCKIPKKSCHTQTGTSNQMIILSNLNKQNKQMIYFAIQGLDKTKFQILLLASNNIINVIHRIPFTYKIQQTQNTVIFYYKNKNKNKQQKSYLTLTVQALPQQIQQILKGIELKMYSLAINKESNKINKNQLALQKPFNSGGVYRKQTTLTYQIPKIFDDIQISLYSVKAGKISVEIMKGRAIFLPIDQEYPIYLSAKQQIKFIVQNIQQQSGIELIIKKCDQSNPFIFYTLDKKQFQSNKYSNYDKFESQNIYNHQIKITNNNNNHNQQNSLDYPNNINNRLQLYIKLKADPKQQSRLIIKVSYIDRQQDINFVDTDPGNMGIIDYEFMNLNELNINFSGLQCNKDCADTTQYYLVQGKSLNRIYNQLVCTGQQISKIFKKQYKSNKNNHDNKNNDSKNNNNINGDNTKKQNIGQKFEQIEQSSSQNEIILRPISIKSNQQNKYSITIPYKSDYPFITIKAIYKPTSHQSYYKPIQIKTFQSNINNYSSKILYIFITIIISALIILVLITQKLSRKGYVHVGQQQTMIV